MDPVCINPWYVGSGVYSGSATLQIIGEGILFTGSATVEWDDTGRTETSLQLDPQFTNAAHRIFEADALSLLVTTPDGIFSAPNAISFHNDVHFGQEVASAVVKLVATESEFTKSNSLEPSYWVAPVVNFVSRFRFRSNQTDRHPLRIYPTPAVPAELEGPAKATATFHANSRNKLIVFNFSNDAGFIEPLPDYGEREKNLKDQRIDRVATAIMVGTIPDSSALDVTSVRSWFPWDFFYALGIASGTFVGSGFVELRGADAQLIKRLHLETRAPKYVSGCVAIDEIFSKDSGSPTGALMEKVLNALSGNKALRSVANFIVAGSSETVIEDAVDFTVRALEALATADGIGKQNLLDGVPVAVQNKVKAALKSAADSIRVEARVAGTQSDTFTLNRLNRIADRTLSASQTENMFGLSVVALLKANGLKDEAVLNKHLASKNPPETWAGFLSNIRGKVIHTGYIDMPTRSELLRAHAYIRHLHDVLLRLFLLKVGYAGTYQPGVAEYAATTSPLTWVQETTRADELRLS